MTDTDIRNLFGFSRQTVIDWKKGKSGEGRKRLYTLLKMLDTDAVLPLINFDKKMLASENSTKQDEHNSEDKEA